MGSTDATYAGESEHARDMATQPALCSVCLLAPRPPYKCPRCRASYCSVRCFGAHSQPGGCSAPPPAPAAPPDAASDAAGAAGAGAGAEDDDGDGGGGGGGGDGAQRLRLRREQLARIGEDRTLVSALRDARLRRILAAIDAAPDRAAALAAARAAHGAPFSRVLDDLLVAVGCAERDANGFVTVNVFEGSEAAAADAQRVAARRAAEALADAALRAASLAPDEVARVVGVEGEGDAAR